MKVIFLLALMVAIVQLVVGIDPMKCYPKKRITKKQCAKLVRECTTSMFLRWTGPGCRDKKKRRFYDGGCQPIDYCGFHCEKACINKFNKFTCKWENGACKKKYGFG